MYLKNENLIYIGLSGDQRVYLYPQMANRHGLISGATGSGKTITLKVLAESFSSMGVPVFLADVKGDIAGMCLPGQDSPDMRKRIVKFGLGATGFDYQAFPTRFYDVYGEQGHPVRTTISEMGPELLGRLLGLTEVQTGVLSVVFQVADDEGLLLLDLKDLRLMLQHVGDNAKEYKLSYGNVSSASVGAIQRALLQLEQAGGDMFFGEPALDIEDWFATDESGRGLINILDCTKLFLSPLLYSTFMLWMLSELYESLPEEGDLDKPKMVFFFDEAHLLFKGASKLLLEKIEQVVKLIRSKGVGVFFITQVPSDIPDGVLAQLGNKVQHALHAYTPNDQKAVRAAANSYRINPNFDTYETLLNLGTGEAIVSFLEEDGQPSLTEKVYVLPPQSQMGAIDDAQRDRQVKGAMLYGKYAEAYDPDSAYEFLQRMGLEEEARREEERETAQAEKEAARQAAAEEKAAAKAAEKAERDKEREKQKESNARKRAAKSVGSSVAGTVGREVGKSVGGKFGKFGKTLGGNVGASLGRGILSTLFKC